MPILVRGKNSDLAVKARKSSESERVTKAKVSERTRASTGAPLCAPPPTKNAIRVEVVMAMVWTMMPLSMNLLMIGSSDGLGGCCMMSGSPFSVPSAKAGAPSVTRFSHKS